MQVVRVSIAYRNERHTMMLASRNHHICKSHTHSDRSRNANDCARGLTCASINSSVRTNFNASVRTFVFAAMFTLVIAFLLAIPNAAFANVVNVGCATLYDINNNKIEAHEAENLEDILEWAEDKVDDGVSSRVCIDLYTDWNTKDYGLIEIGEGTYYRFNLNGHMITRGEASTKYYGSGNGQIFRVKGHTASLDVYGGNGTDEGDAAAAKIEHPGYLVKDKTGGLFWVYSEKVNTFPICGGLLTGGACDDSDGAGAASVTNGATLTINGVTVAGNVSDTWCSSYGHGGGLASYAQGTLRVYNCDIMYNHAEGCGGGLYSGKDAGTIDLYNTTVSFNTAIDNGGGIGVDSSSLWDAGEQGFVTIVNSNITSNNAGGSGGGFYSTGNGAILTMREGSSISYNTAKENGGGIAFEKVCNMHLYDRAYISNNSAGENGGGLYISSTTYTHVTLENDVFIHHNSAGGSGGGMYLDKRHPVLDSAGWYKFDVSNTNILSNTAKENGGGVYAYAVTNYDNTESGLVFNGTSCVRGNTAKNGGGFYLEDTPKLTLNGTSVTGNSASENGGGIYSCDNDFILNTEDDTNAQVSNNTATKNGGGFYIDSSGEDVLIEKLALSNNKAANGGGLYMANSGDPLAIKNLTITNNKADTGAGLWFSGMLNATNIAVQSNAATTQGGGVYCDNTAAGKFVRLLGEVIVDSNTADGERNNFVLKDTKGSQHLQCKSEDGKEKLSENSRIGVTVSGYDGSEKRLISQTQDFVNFFGDKAFDIVYSDDYAYSVVNVSNGYLAFDKIPAKFTLNVYSTSETPVSSAVDYGSTVELKSSDYAKTEPVDGKQVQSLPRYWTLEYGEVSATITPKNGVTSFTMPGSDVDVHAHYEYMLTGITIDIDDSSTWDTLGTDKALSKVSKVNLVNSVGKTYTTGDYTEGTVIPMAGTCVTSVGAIQKKDPSTLEVISQEAYYEITVDKALFETANLPFDINSISSSEVNVTVPFATASQTECSFRLDENGNLVVTTFVAFMKPGSYGITVKMIDANTVGSDSPTAVGTCVKAFDEAQSTTTIQAPWKRGWGFFKWGDDLPSTALPVDDKVTFLSVSSNIGITALYTPTLMDISYTMDTLYAGNTFPQGFTSIVANDKSDYDVEDKNTATALTWQNSDGSALAEGAVVEAGKEYKLIATTTTIQPTETHRYAYYDGGVYTSLNGRYASSSDPNWDKKTVTSTFYVKAVERPVKEYSHVITDFDPIELIDATAYENKLTGEVEYAFTDGSTAKASIIWEAPSANVEDQPDAFTVKGTFTSEDGVKREVSQQFNLSDVSAPVITPETGTYTSPVDISVSFPEDAAAMTVVVTDIASGKATTDTCRATKTYQLAANTLIEATAFYGENGARHSETITAEISIDDSHAIVVVRGKAYDKDKQEVTSAFEGESITISADEAASGKYFANWEVDAGNVEVGSATAQTTTFSMGAEDVSISAVQADKIMVGLNFAGTEKLVENGSAHPVDVLLTEVLEGDDVSCVVEYKDVNGNVLNGAPINAGSYTATVVELIGEDAYKYYLPQSTSCEFVIEKANSPVDPDGDGSNGGNNSANGGNGKIVNTGDSSPIFAIAAVAVVASVLVVALLIASKRRRC